jgi:hypothetical protein
MAGRDLDTSIRITRRNPKPAHTASDNNSWNTVGQPYPWGTAPTQYGRSGRAAASSSAEEEGSILRAAPGEEGSILVLALAARRKAAEEALCTALAVLDTQDQGNLASIRRHLPVLHTTRGR